MKYTAAQRRELAAAFRAAKPLLWSGKDRVIPPGQTGYICYALRGAYFRGSVLGPTSRLAQELIAGRLDGHSTAVDWLYHRRGVPMSLLTSENVQDWRHRWLDMLIEEFSS